MRPAVLNPLFASITALPGVGPKVEKLFRRLIGRDREEIPRILDLLFHLPTGSIDRRARPRLRDVVPGTLVTVAVTVESHRAPPPGRSRAPAFSRSDPRSSCPRFPSDARNSPTMGAPP